MDTPKSKTIIIVLSVLLVLTLAGGAYHFYRMKKDKENEQKPVDEPLLTGTPPKPDVDTHKEEETNKTNDTYQKRQAPSS